MNEVISTQGPNSDQIEFWNGEAARKWIDFNPLLDRMHEPLTTVAMDRAGPAAGERVLDIGCGCGGTSLDLAQRVAPGGSVTALDISEPMLEVARQKALAAAAPVEIINGDAESHEFPPAAFDLLFSRFGIMFFANPKAAFANFHQALKPGGRMTFMCWRDTELNPWVTVPLEAARPLAPAFDPPKPDAAGQFAFAREAWIGEILNDTGFADIDIEAHDITLRMGEGDLDECTALVLKLGTVSRLMREADEAAIPAISEAVRAAVAPYHDGRSIEMDASVWIVGARRP